MVLGRISFLIFTPTPSTTSWPLGTESQGVSGWILLLLNGTNLPWHAFVICYDVGLENKIRISKHRTVVHKTVIKNVTFHQRTLTSANVKSLTLAGQLSRHCRMTGDFFETRTTIHWNNIKLRQRNGCCNQKILIWIFVFGRHSNRFGKAVWKMFQGPSFEGKTSFQGLFSPNTSPYSFMFTRIVTPYT